MDFKRFYPMIAIVLIAVVILSGLTIFFSTSDWEISGLARGRAKPTPTPEILAQSNQAQQEEPSGKRTSRSASQSASIASVLPTPTVLPAPVMAAPVIKAGIKEKDLGELESMDPKAILNLEKAKVIEILSEATEGDVARIGAEKSENLIKVVGNLSLIHISEPTRPY